MKIRPWQPDKGETDGPQRRFLSGAGPVYEVLNAGSVGAGKTDAGVMGAVWYKEYRSAPSFAGLILRHDEKDLAKHVMPLVTRPGYYQRYAGGGLNETTLTYRLKSGGRVIFTHAKRLSGLHGPEFQYCWWDELSHWRGAGWLEQDPPPEYGFVITRLRSASGVRVRLRAGTNAYGPGKAWVRRRWAPWLDPGCLAVAEGAPPHHRAAAESLRRLVAAGVLPDPIPGRPLVPSGHVLWVHPHADGTETYEAPPADEDDARRRELLSRTCLLSRTEDNPALRQGDPQYSLRTRAAGALLYQQLSGNDWEAEEPGEGFFQRAWFDVVRRDAVPRLAGVVRRWDFAWSRHEKGGKQAERSPWTAGVLLGWTHRRPGQGRDWYILDIRRMQGDPNAVMQEVHRTAMGDGIHVPVLAPVDFSAGKVVISDLRNLLEGFRVVESREHGDKDVRIATLQNPAEQRRIHLVGGEWNHAFGDEAARYPRRPVDQLDALAGAYLHVIESEGGIPSQEEVDGALEQMQPLAHAFDQAAAPRPAPTGYYRDFEDDEDGGRNWGGDYGVPG